MNYSRSFSVLRQPLPIARTLTSHTGKPWVMRLRSLSLFQSWMEEAGLGYVSHRLEKHGIFGVVKTVKL